MAARHSTTRTRSRAWFVIGVAVATSVLATGEDGKITWGELLYAVTSSALTAVAAYMKSPLSTSTPLIDDPAVK